MGIYWSSWLVEGDVAFLAASDWKTGAKDGGISSS